MPTPSRNPLSPSARFRRTRAAHRHETCEDYVEAIDGLIREKGEARVRDLAVMMGVSHVTVTRTIARLRAQDLVNSDPHRPITLSRGGEALAARARERHHVVLSFLLAVGVPEATAEIDAEGIEHHVSEDTIDALRRISARTPGRAS